MIAFRVANHAMAKAARRRQGVMNGIAESALKLAEWRPFQLAFLLMNLPGIAQPQSDDRQTVDLLFFPTGGGKTEAYLGLAAFTLVLRRLRNKGVTGAGVSVLMRYTLRLLTLDQLGRAATLIALWSWNVPKARKNSVTGRLKLVFGWAAPPHQTKWAVKSGRIPTQPDSAQSRSGTTIENLRRFRWKTVPGVARSLSATRFVSLPAASRIETTQKICKSDVSIGTVRSAAAARFRSLQWMRRFIAVCRVSSSRLSISSPACPGLVRSAHCLDGWIAMTKTGSMVL